MKKFIVDTGKKKYKVTANTYDEAIKAVKCVVNDAEMYRGYKIYKVAGDWEVRSPQNEIWNYDGYLSLNEVKKLLDKGIDKGIWDSLDEASPLQTVNALLEDERAAVDAYNVALENLKGKIPEESYKAIEAIRNDENRHIENLQAVVNGNVTEKNLKDATGHEVVVYTNQILSEMGLNNSIGKYDKVVQAMRSLYSESLKSGEELKEVIRRDMPRILKKYGYHDAITEKNLEDSVKDEAEYFDASIEMMIKAAKNKDWQRVADLALNLINTLKRDKLAR